jgi:hypothetical protein
MRRWWVVCGLSMLGWLYGAACLAAPTGGLATLVGPGGGAVSAGVAYSQRDVTDGRNDQVSSLRTLLRGQVGVLDGLDLYGFIGFTDLLFDHTDFEGSRGGGFGGGVRYGLLSFPDSGLRLVLDLQGEYSRVNGDNRNVRSQAYHAAVYLLKEFGAAGKVGYFYPYGGAQVSYAKHDGRGQIDNFHSRDVVGIFGGADYFVNPNVFFSGEIHLLDETSIAVGAGYRF